MVGPRLFQKVGSSKTKVAEAQIELLVSALNTYRLDNSDYPTTEQGLGALILAPEGSTSWDGPYLAKELGRSVGRPYHYELKNTGEYALYTLGKDNRKGGEGEDRDIGRF